MNQKKLGIYIHIPFCVRKCAYCDFLSGISTREKQREYVTILCKEIENKAPLLRGYDVATLYLGGGTPSVLEVEALEKIIYTCKKEIKNWHIVGEVTIEMNPGTIDKEKLIAYRTMGINRLSIGLQATDNRLLQQLGRIHKVDEFMDTFRWAREVGFSNINVDLMSGLPTQTLADWEKSLRMVINLQPEHISAYSLIIEEDTPFYQQYGEGKEKEHLLPTEEIERKMYDKTKEILEKNGYLHYEISNYAKKGYEAKHNCSYWEGRSYLGFGLGASSYYKGERYKNETELETYLSLGRKDIFEKKEIEKISRKEEMEEFMFLGLRKIEGVCAKEFFERFQITIDNIYGQQLKALEQKKLLQRRGENIALTERGIDISNRVLSEFLLE